MEKRRKSIRIFHSLDEENESEYQRCALMTPEQRMAEFDVLQQRCWGADWFTKPIERVVEIRRIP